MNNDYTEEMRQDDKANAAHLIGLRTGRLILARDLVTSREIELREAITHARDHGMTVQEIADVIGKSRPWVYAFMEKGQ